MSPMLFPSGKIGSPHFPCAAVCFSGLGCFIFLPQCDSCAGSFFLGSGINVGQSRLHICKALREVMYGQVLFHI